MCRVGSETPPNARRYRGPAAPCSCAVSRAQGFSLPELLAAVAIVAILAGVAAPGFAAWVDSTRLGTATSDFLGSLYFARSEAIKRNGRVTVCSSGDASRCQNGGWHLGWVVFEDSDGDGLRGEDEEILAVGAPRSGRLTMIGSAPVRDYISYMPTGETRSVSGALQMGRVTACVDGRGRRIIIAATGRPRVVRDAGC